MATQTKGISYLNRDYNDYRNALIEFSKKYYPDLDFDLGNDASVGSWLVDMNADIADNLSYHIDRVYQETNIDTAAERGSLYSLARNNGFKVPGRKGSMAEVEFTCLLPPKGDIGPDWQYAPIIRRGTKLNAGSQTFELLDDVDFGKQFDNNGNSDRTITPRLDSNNIVVGYKIGKLAVVVAGETRIYKKAVVASDIKPFMEIVLPDTNVMNVESIVVKDGINLYSNPSYGEFYSNNEDIKDKNGNDCGTKRFFEVESLAQQKIWGVNEEKNGGEPYLYGYVDANNNCVPTYSIVRGEWKNIHNKFITEFTDKGYLKITFGSGLDSTSDSVDLSDAKPFSKFQISRIIRNDSLGYLPRENSTIFVLYRVGGGKVSNVAAGAINNIGYLNSEIGGSERAISDAVRQSIKVKSTTPSVSGKDMPTPEELKYLIKYNSGAQNRCVTVKDYVSRVLQMPPKYGTPFRVSASEENNKIMLNLLGLDNNGKLDDTLPTALVENIRDYLAEYRTINDYVEIKSGRIINLSFEVDVFVDRNYNKADVMAGIISTITDYMDINKHNMGDDMFVGDIKRAISSVDGVLNLIDIRIYNVYSGGYSKTMTKQETKGESMSYSADSTAKAIELDLDASDYMVLADNDSLLEIRQPEKDIQVRCKTI